MAAARRTTQQQRFLKRTREALAKQREICAYPEQSLGDVFTDLLEVSRNTAFGAEHGIGQVHTERDWKKAVPIRDYDALKSYAERQFAGERAVLTADEPYAFLRTSGTTGHAKLVPSTSHWRNRYRGPALYAQWGLYFERIGIEELAVDEALDLSWEPGPVRRHQQGFPVYGITERPVPEDAGDWNPPWSTAAWFSRDPEASTLADSLYTKLLRLAGRNVHLVVSVNPSKIALLAETLRDNSTRLLRDLHDGHPHMGEVDRDLASRLEAVFNRAGGEPRLTDLWPGLRLLVCWNSASAGLYRPWLSRLAPGVATLPFSATGTEGIVTLPVDDHPSAGPLAVDQGHYEFVPWRDLDDGRPLPPDSPTLSCHELEEGADYRLVMSQANGLYRYDVGDVYRVVGTVGATPRLEFLGRAGFQSSFTGEKVTESDVYIAVTTVLGGDRADFSAIPVWDTPPHYLVAVEWAGDRAALDVEHTARRIDDVLQEVNVEYADKRRSGRLRQVRLLPLVTGAFRAVAEQRFQDGAAGAQLKHHWLCKDSSLLTVLSELELVHYSLAGV